MKDYTYRVSLSAHITDVKKYELIKRTETTIVYIDSNGYERREKINAHSHQHFINDFESAKSCATSHMNRKRQDYQQMVFQIESQLSRVHSYMNDVEVSSKVRVKSCD